MRFGPFFLIIITVIGLSNCASYDFSRKIVQQGNLLPSSTLAKLHVGMSKEDTAILMGTSLLSPNFDNNRWDYAFSQRKGNGPLVVKNMSLYFANERLMRIERHP